MDRLPPKTQDAIRLRYLDGHWPREIAEQLGDTPSAVSSRIERGLVRLREELRGREPDLWPLD